MKNEFDIVSDFDHEKIANLFYALHAAISDKNWNLLNLETCKSKVNEALRALELKMRFDRLDDLVNGKLNYGSNGFSLHDHKFETLDEVEKAINNKAFL